MISDPNPGPVSPRRKRAGWADLVVKVCMVVVLGAVLGHFVLPRYFGRSTLTDRQRWLARPKLEAKPSANSASSDVHQSTPCLFIAAPGVSDGAATAGTVADCLTLVPDGKKMDVLEINLKTGELFL